MTLLFIVLLPSSVMLCLFINISKLSLDNFLLQTTCIAVLLCLIFLFGWNLQTLGMCTRLVFRLISRALIMHEALNAVFKILPSTQSLHFFFFLCQIQQEGLELLACSDFTIGNLCAMVGTMFPCKLRGCIFLSLNLHLAVISQPGS